MQNPKALAILGTRHRTKTNKNKNTTQQTTITNNTDPPINRVNLGALDRYVIPASHKIYEV